MMTRRQALKTSALATAAFAALPGAIAQPASPAPERALVSTAPQPFTLPPLPYAYDALEPYIDAETMHIHHDKHHAAYVANLNKAWQKMPWGGPPPNFAYLENNWLKDPKFLAENTAVRNNGGGHYNHSLFWLMMKPGGGGEPTGELAKAIDASFGSFGAFKEQFTKAAMTLFGSGWAWLVLDNDKLKIADTPNQDSPLSQDKPVLLGLDVWEHAYYLNNQNRRADYVAAWWNVVNWDFVSGRYAKLKS